VTKKSKAGTELYKWIKKIIMTIEEAQERLINGSKQQGFVISAN